MGRARERLAQANAMDQTGMNAMLYRRSLLIALAAAGLVPGLGRADPAPAQTGLSRQLHALFDRFVREQLQRSPEMATSLGLDTGRWRR